MSQIVNPHTPGVKLVEKSILPPSVVQVSTAIPVFLGYTEEGEIGVPKRITSLKDYQDAFGGGDAQTFTISGTSGNYSASLSPSSFFLYEAMQLYFMNGGGACYIIPVGLYVEDDGTGTMVTNTLEASDFIGDPQNNKPDWMSSIKKLDEPTIIAFPEAVGLDLTDYKDVVSSAVAVCENTKDKFVLVDAPNGSDLLDFNQNGGLSNYRAAITDSPYAAAYYPSLKTTAKYKVDESNYPGSPAVGSADYTAISNAVNAVNRAIIPPSALMAGVYAKVDRERGVWKAPANVALQGVIEPTVQVSDADQHELNVDATAGKSINALRQFVGKGTVVWGARTLDGNNNEWRYVNVRRLFITVEESVSKACAQFVFENNDAKTWSKVNSMIKSYLNGLWKEGALIGASAEEAYFVEVGLGTTMSQQDILEGKMIVRIGLAAVRPAEFIILEFSHFVNQ